VHAIRPGPGRVAVAAVLGRRRRAERVAGKEHATARVVERALRVVLEVAGERRDLLLADEATVAATTLVGPAFSRARPGCVAEAPAPVAGGTARLRAGRAATARRAGHADRRRRTVDVDHIHSGVVHAARQLRIGCERERAANRDAQERGTS